MFFGFLEDLVGSHQGYRVRSIADGRPGLKGIVWRDADKRKLFVEFGEHFRAVVHPAQ